MTRKGILFCQSVFVSALVLPGTTLSTACGEGANSPAAPSVVSTTSAVSIAPGEQSKTSVCHRTKGVNAFVPISVAGSAVDAHLAHGDALVGGPAPGRPGMVLNAECSATPQAASAAPLFNFASMGCD